MNRTITLLGGRADGRQVLYTGLSLSVVAMSGDTWSDTYPPPLETYTRRRYHVPSEVRDAETVHDLPDLTTGETWKWWTFEAWATEARHFQLDRACQRLAEAEEAIRVYGDDTSLTAMRDERRDELDRLRGLLAS